VFSTRIAIPPKHPEVELLKKSIFNQKGGRWMKHIGSSVLLSIHSEPCPNREIQEEIFFLQSNLMYALCGHNRLESRAHTLDDGTRFNHKTDDQTRCPVLNRQPWRVRLVKQRHLCCSSISAFPFLFLSLLSCLDQLRVIWF